MFRHKQIILNLNPDEIFAILPDSQVVVENDGTQFNSFFRRSSSEPFEYEVFSTFVSTASGDYSIEFASEDERDEFIEALYKYVSGSSTTKSAATTVKSEQAKKAPAKTPSSKKNSK